MAKLFQLAALGALSSLFAACAVSDPAPVHAPPQAIATTTEPQSAVVKPDARFGRWRHGLTFFRSADRRFEMRAKPDLEARTVEVDHRFFPAPPSRSEQILSETIAVRFWPTSVGPAGNGRLCVAGVDPKDGATILEIWRFEPPFKDPREPRNPTRSFTIGHVASIDVIYDARTPGMDTAYRILDMPAGHGSVPRLLVQFADSPSLYEFDVDTGAHRLVAAPTPQPGALLVPLLARPLLSEVRRHRDEGMLYMFSEPDGDSVPPGADEDALTIAVLRDRDLDARIDDAEVMSLNQYRARGYLEREAWIDE